ncbi:Svf1p TDEL_0E02270 [Torulaspora delbrueckii]|uniref:Survival factor 1 n=1 Tax=Torulaspora delbrueckii TaxID=4950 RepID=G8ZV26_TORDE|nr:hypothetical protein TDEL_0E02270 [Torulaspora delbrueckii]CCE92470.1 hypothetical protein TDEL_0E02270 [Torulaspora delbrueckii]
MLKWIQGGLSAVTGIAEPEYGSDYIHTVTDRVEGKQPFCETTREDFCWLKPDHTNVETVTFYFSDLTTGVVGFAQIIHSNIVGIHTQAQFTFRIFNSKKPDELNLWTSTKLEDFRVEGPNFYAKDLSLELNEEDNEYHFVSQVNEKSTVDLTFTRLTPGCKVGEDPNTYYGDNLEEPWGKMRHVFWPRNSIRGTINLKKPEPTENEEQEEEPQETGKSVYEEQTITFGPNDKAYSMFVMAFQGMKPHHAAKAWNFMYFHSEKHTAVLMEFVTPKSYANTKVTIGILTSDKDILAVTTNNEFSHLDPQIDSVGWNVPQSVSIAYDGFSPEVTDEQVASGDYKKVTAKVEGPLQNLIERIDVMNEIPNFIKTIVSGVAGTKPYIYQYAEDNFTLQVDDQPYEHGVAWTEVTFISESDVITEEAYNES